MWNARGRCVKQFCNENCLLVCCVNLWIVSSKVTIVLTSQPRLELMVWQCRDWCQLLGLHEHVQRIWPEIEREFFGLPRQHSPFVIEDQDSPTMCDVLAYTSTLQFKPYDGLTIFYFKNLNSNVKSMRQMKRFISGQRLGGYLSQLCRNPYFFIMNRLSILWRTLINLFIDW